MRLTRFEHKSQPIVPRAVFIQRLGFNVLVVLALIAASLLVGMVGYRTTEGMAWLDAFLNASMILSGMGPVTVLVEPAAKYFAGFYALYSGLTLVAASGLILAPVVHRVFHGLHVKDDGEG
jgi:hypothetical protein